MSPGAGAGRAAPAFAVIGSPIAHSLSPVMHRAAYAALGVEGPTYEAFDVADGELEEFLIRGAGRELDGLSVTMPGKPEAFAIAREHDHVSQRLSISNTLLRRTDGSWRAENHDVHGVVASLADHGITAVRRGGVIGSGATAVSAAYALVTMGAAELLLTARSPQKLAALGEQARGFGARPQLVPWEESHRVLEADAVVSAVAAVGAPAVREQWAAVAQMATPTVFLDVLYEPWPSPLTSLVQQRGGEVASGLEMLVHQAGEQVRSMVGVERAPLEAMREAAWAELRRRG